MNSLQIKDRKAQIKLRSKEIISICKQEIREMTDDEKAEFEANKEEIKNLNQQLRELEDKLSKYDEEIDEADEVEETQTEEQPQEDKRNKTNISNMKSEFRLIKAIRDVANNRSLDETAQAVIEAGNKEMRTAGLNYQGQIQLPTSEMRAAITVTAEGEDVVATNLYDIIAPLRAKNVLVQAGAKFLDGLVGDVQIPTMSASNVTWEGETASAKDGAGAFSSVKLSPKRLTAYVDISKQFLAQDSLSAEAMIRQDLINAINSKLEATILGDNATAGIPAGMLPATKTADLTATTTFAGLCDVEASIEDANINGECKYVMSNKAKAAVRAMAKSAKSTELVYEGGNIDGTPVLNTSHVADKYFIYGDFSYLAIGSWGGVDLTVDPYTKAAEGQIRLVVNAYFDAKVLNENAFAIGKF